MPMIPRMVRDCCSGMSGLPTIHGNGKVTTTQITPSRIINLAFFFLSCNNDSNI